MKLLSQTSRVREMTRNSRRQAPALTAIPSVLLFGVVAFGALIFGSPFFSSALFAAPQSSASKTTLSGQIQLVEKGKDRSRREGPFTVLYFMPEKSPVVEPLKEVPAITMTRKQFVPRILPITRGTAIDFPNQDGISHNVFSLSGKNRFDLGLYRRGESRQKLLESPGVVQIFCNVHHSMVAYVLVLDTPFFTMPDRDGRFQLTGLPKGKGKLVAWHERAEPKTIELALTTTRDLSVTLEITKPRIPPHRNKFGKPYSRKRRGKAY